MTLSYFVSLAECRIEVTLGAHALRADRRRALQAVLELLGEHPDSGLLIDACVPMRPLTGAEARWIVETVANHARLFQGGVALLTDPGLTYGAPRLQQAKTALSGVELGVFGQREAAVGWLASRAGRGAGEQAGR
jgi:hypothetical protein